MFRLVAFSESRTPATAFENVAGLADPHVAVKDDSIYVPAETPHLMAVLVGVQTATSGSTMKAKLWTPSKRSIFITPFEDATTGTWEPLVPSAINNLMQHNTRLVPGEAIQAFTANSQATNAERATFLVWLGDGIYVVPPGKEIITKRFTTSAASVAYTWTNMAITFEEALEAGVYAVVGMNVVSASALAARLLFTNQQPRPGCPGYDSFGDVGHPLFRHGNLGIWGTFTHESPPTIDVLCHSTETTREGVLDLIKLT
jgi:hypothetical protein